VAASFIGRDRQGIHRAPIFANFVITPRASLPFGTKAARTPNDLITPPHVRFATVVGSRRDSASPRPSLVNVQSARLVEPRGFEPRTSAVQGRRSPG
jgi:hypothetical protein